MLDYMIIRNDTGHADLVRIVPDLIFEVKASPSRPHGLYFFNREAMSVSHTQHRISPGKERFSPVPMHLHHVEHLNAVARIKMQ